MKKILFILFATARLVAEIPTYQHFDSIECDVQERRVSVDSVTSDNWSGYAVETNFYHPQIRSVSNVQGTWTVPTLVASAPAADSYSAIWVGIDGYSSGTVEQIGTEQDWIGGTQQNYAWFEMYPQGSFEITGFPVNAGDQIGADVSYVGDGVFQMIMINYTQSVYTIVPPQYTISAIARRTSAEWIVEAPSDPSVLPLANFGTVTFEDCEATISCQTGSINSPQWQYEALTMVTPPNTIKAVPSSLKSKGTSFSVFWQHQ